MRVSVMRTVASRALTRPPRSTFATNAATLSLSYFTYGSTSTGAAVPLPAMYARRAERAGSNASSTCLVGRL